MLSPDGEDVAGYWQGIEFGTVSAGNALEHVVISNAGSRAWIGGAHSTTAVDDAAAQAARPGCPGRRP